MADDAEVPADLVTPQASRFNIIDPANLGTMEALEDISSEKIIADRKARFKELWEQHDPPAGAVYDVENLEFDPIVIAIEAGADAEMKLRNRVNQAVRDVTLAFAFGHNLEGIASRYPGGVPRLDGESDTAYRRRVWLSPNIFTPHGVAEAYIFWALTSDVSYRDASALTKPASGHIFIPVLLNAPGTSPWVKKVGVDQNEWTRNIDVNVIPTPPQRLATFKYISQPGRKGLTDVIHVVNPKVVSTTYDIQIWLYPGADMPTVMSDVRAALDKQVEDHRWLGNDHTIFDIEAACKRPGVYNAKVISPAADVLVGFDGFVKVTSMHVKYMGTGE